MSNNIAGPLELALPAEVETELNYYEEQIKKYRRGELGETKMQKIRLHFGTYAQRQEGVQMQRIKIPGGVLTADQLNLLADAADRYGSGFMHFTTREDAQIYYVKLDKVTDLLRFLASGGITTREACGNTVRNITACYRAGTSVDEAFDVTPYAEALFRFLVRNKLNQNLGRKFKITFEGCAEDHSRLRIHDIGFWATTRTEGDQLRYGFRVYLGGGLGADPHLAHLYTDFLPVEDLFNFAAATLRLFDRYGERKARMKARMKFLVASLGWENFLDALETERRLVGPIPLPAPLNEPLQSIHKTAARSVTKLNVLNSQLSDKSFLRWAHDSVIPHKDASFSGVHVRIKLGDLTAGRARELAAIARRFSASHLRISIEQNIYLPWVRKDELVDLYLALTGSSLAERGVGTIADITTCPGSDTCRLGIASAKGLGSALDEAFNSSMAAQMTSFGGLKIKISGCPNGCAQHSIANIGFYSAALTNDERTVPAHFVTLGGQAEGDAAKFGSLLGKFPAKNCVALTETLLKFYERGKLRNEAFNSFVERIGINKLKTIVEPLQRVPSYETDPSFYTDYGHEHERFAVRKGVKGECAGPTVAEEKPTLESAQEWLAKADAYLYHKEYENAVIASYEAAAAAVRVPLYQRLVDPFNSTEALWEFENLFVLSGQTAGQWTNFSANLEELKASALQLIKQAIVDKKAAASDDHKRTVTQRILDHVRCVVAYCATFEASVSVSAA